MSDQQPVFARLFEKTLDLRGNYRALVFYIFCSYPECPFRARGQCLIEWPNSSRCPNGTTRVLYGPWVGTRKHQEWVAKQRGDIEILGLVSSLPVPLEQRKVTFLGDWVYVPYDCFFGEYSNFVPKDRWNTQTILSTIRHAWLGKGPSDDIFEFLADLYKADNALWHQMEQAVNASLVHFSFTTFPSLPSVEITVQDGRVVVSVGNKTYTQPPDLSIGAGILWGVSMIAEEIGELSNRFLSVSPVTSAAQRVQKAVSGVRIEDWKNQDVPTRYRQFNDFCTDIYNSVLSLRKQAQFCSVNIRDLCRYITDLNRYLSRYEQNLRAAGIDVTIPRIGEEEKRNIAEVEKWLSGVTVNSNRVLRATRERSASRKRMLDQIIETQEFSLVEKLREQTALLAHLASSPPRDKR